MPRAWPVPRLSIRVEAAPQRGSFAQKTDLYCALEVKI
jgi:hypothetical protein